ncbi:hypothetical protein [Moorena sp. SIO3A2]|uniref:hypothetical protein n=1 Tax=Moorena sp. SIO3A2 TaxID=2607841 RepID=UPI0013B79945|nr:hypothetical protein [Moorena sp. SIO3A2]NER92200.1 hypothetical protein [Moorena sp. SIO3A2]
MTITVVCDDTREYLGVGIKQRSRRNASGDAIQKRQKRIVRDRPKKSEVSF